MLVALIPHIRETPGRQVVRRVGESLEEAMQMALTAGEPSAAELVACECVFPAETKDHLDWAQACANRYHVRVQHEVLTLSG